MKFGFIFCGFLLFALFTNAQEKDSIQLEDVPIRSYFSEYNLRKAPASISLLSEKTINQQAPFSPLQALNTSAGIRFEERSPSSFRLSIRGSLLRSPFGVRNIKIYTDDFLFTDAGGNTYLNLLDFTLAPSIEIIKGPEGSIYGANTGGVVIIQPHKFSDSLAVNAQFNIGAYQTHQQAVSLHKKLNKAEITLVQSSQKSDGCRYHSQTEKKFIQLLPKFNLGNRGLIKANLFYTDLFYQTPGGLTAQQVDENPKSARIIAESQKAAVFNKTFFAGVGHEHQLNSHFNHAIYSSASFTKFRNPFVTNYEERNEHSLSLRLIETWKNEMLFPIHINGGIEIQQTQVDLNSFTNVNGNKTDLLKASTIQANSLLSFGRLNMQPFQNLNVESAISLNQFKYQYEQINANFISEHHLKTNWMPRFALSYQAYKMLNLRASVSKGFSNPTIEELNPSGIQLNSNLKAEFGWNKEIGVRLFLFKNNLILDLVAFNYNLKNAIVRSLNANETEYYLNSGKTKQQGLEYELTFTMVNNKSHALLKSLVAKNSLTRYNFKFIDYEQAGKQYSGNYITGIPAQNITSSINLSFQKNISFNLQHNYISKIPLNDANNYWSETANLLRAKLAKQVQFKKISWSIYGGAENLLNEKYSMGYDLNANGNRFYNPAANRNFYFGTQITI